MKIQSSHFDLALMPGKRNMCRPRGFTLVEVAMAMGLFAFALIPIIGLLGVGLKTSQDTIRVSTCTRIFEQCEPLVRMNGNGAVNFTASGQIATDSQEAVYTASWSDVSETLASSESNSARGLLASRVIKVTIERTAVTPKAILAETFVMFSKDPKDL